MNRGGKRIGAGRKRSVACLRKEQIGLKLPRWLIDWLNSRPESRAVLIEDAIRRQHGIDPP